MVRQDINNWYRLEGLIIPPEEYEYSTPIDNIKTFDIWYSNVEVQLQNPTIGTHINGVIYKTRKFSDYGLKTIEEINANYSAILNTMLIDMRESDGALTYTEPFVITESTVICYGDSQDNNLVRYTVILKDDYTVPKMAAITSEYVGPPIAIGESIDYQFLTITGHFNDGSTTLIANGAYTITRVEDETVTNVINKVGSNLFTVTVVYGENTFTSNFSVTGIKKLVGITAEYDGPSIALNKSPKRNNIIVVARYSDNTTGTVTDWSYGNGDTITVSNDGVLDIYYSGFRTTVKVPYYDTSVTQIKAFYNGPKVEVGKDFSLDYLTVKIYYQNSDDTKSYWEEIEQEFYIVSRTKILYEKDNVIGIVYKTNTGNTLATTFIVEGIIPEKKIVYLTAEYVGPPIQVGKVFNPEKVICKAHWNNNDITLIKDFTVSTTIINNVGLNEIILKYKESSCPFVITGVAVENTTDTGYTPTEVDLLYPEGFMVNHRRRGPMESEKFDAYSKFVYDNITKLYEVFNTLEEQYKEMKSIQNVGANTLNTCIAIDEKISLLNKRR